MYTIKHTGDKDGFQKKEKKRRLSGNYTRNFRKAEEKAKAMVSEEVITKQAQNRAHEILTSAQTKSKEIKSATNKYVESMLSRVDELLTSNLTDVRKTRASLKDSKN